MQDLAPEKHIFKDAEHFFTERIHSFHDKFVDCSLLTGVDKPEAKLDKIKMTKNPKFTLLYYKRIFDIFLSSESIQPRPKTLFCSRNFAANKNAGQ